MSWSARCSARARPSKRVRGFKYWLRWWQYGPAPGRFAQAVKRLRVADSFTPAGQRLYARRREARRMTRQMRRSCWIFQRRWAWCPFCRTEMIRAGYPWWWSRAERVIYFWCACCRNRSRWDWACFHGSAPRCLDARSLALGRAATRKSGWLKGVMLAGQKIDAPSPDDSAQQWLDYGMVLSLHSAHLAPDYWLEWIAKAYDAKWVVRQRSIRSQEILAELRRKR